jgi:hypothetical protein
MNVFMVISDQLYEWSEIFQRLFYTILKKEKNPFIKKGNIYSSLNFAWFFVRTIQEMQQTWLYLYKNQQRSWPKILSFNKLSKTTANSRIYPVRLSKRRYHLFTELSEITWYSRRNLFYQQRINKKEKNGIGIFFYDSTCSTRACSSRFSWQYINQYACQLDNQRRTNQGGGTKQ